MQRLVKNWLLNNMKDSDMREKLYQLYKLGRASVNPNSTVPAAKAAAEAQALIDAIMAESNTKETLSNG